MKQAWDDLRAAVAFLTRLPTANQVVFDDRRLVRSMGLFPAVGLLLGLGLVLANALLGQLLPRSVVDGLLLVLLVLLTGGLHLDGLADLTDGLAGGRDRASTLRIMKDSRVGAMGAIALVLLLLLKYLSLSALPPELKNAGLLLMPCAGRWCQLFLARCSSYLRSEGGTGALFVEQVGDRELLCGSLTLLAALLVLLAVPGLWLALWLLIGCALLLHYFERRLGGVTGDVLGAATELVEVFTLLLLLALF